MRNLGGIEVGFAVVMAVVILAVAIYTVVKLRRQVGKRSSEEKAKKDGLKKNKF
jgi:Na+-transporting methylmalonyl-CoA/oxaloacetate decarboxylase gamma subunit